REEGRHRPRRRVDDPPEARRLGVARRARGLLQAGRHLAEGGRVTPDLNCYGSGIRDLADLVGDFDLRSPMDVHAWYRLEWQAIAEVLGFSQDLEAALAPLRVVRDRLAATNQAGLDAFARWLPRTQPGLSDSHARGQAAVLRELESRALGELWRVSVGPATLATGACHDGG